MKRVKSTAVGLALCATMFGCGGGKAKSTTTTTTGGGDTTQTTTTTTPPTNAHAGHHGGEAPPAMPSWTLEGMAKDAVLIDDLGKFERKVTTKSPEAQKYFTQGLRLIYGFNHDEAARSFAKAGALDASCVMCWWGTAYALGPNYNVPMLPERSKAAWDALQRAKKAAAGASPVEQALVGALAARYKGPEWVDPVSMGAFNQKYADAMRKVAAKFGDDDDVLALTGEAIMNVNPWKLWSADGKPAAGTEEVVAMLEKVLARNAAHPGANHYYIHAVEASKEPSKAVAAADRLGPLMPAAGHLVHMPAHIYQRVGRYADASAANQRAIASDRKYLEKVTPLGYYPVYLAHNHGFLSYSASMLGQAKASLDAARESAKSMPKEIVCNMPGMDYFLTAPYFVMIRFGKWDEMIAEPKPDAKYHSLIALWHHGHGMALASKGKLEEARADLTALQGLAKATPAELMIGLDPGQKVLTLAATILEARILEAEKKDAIGRWQEAVTMEDSLNYSEPATWFYPVRHYLGSALLDAKKPKEAEAVFRADLERNPGNGWGLFGVWKSLAAQKKTKDAKAAEKQFTAAWKNADIKLTRAAF
jgi:tetratricopeptide (TPR) repeat protein